MALPQLIIAAKRDRQSLSPGQIEDFVRGVADGRISDAQIAAFAMAVLLNGMDVAERGALTTAMARSGRVLDWSHAAARAQLR
jgi:thymidine phosphorylase